jgi:hypothetical protein
MKYSIPGVGVYIPIQKTDAVLSKDGRTYICRIAYNETTRSWEANTANRGLLVFLNDGPTDLTTHIRITAIQSSGKAAWADPVALSHAEQGYYD